MKPPSLDTLSTELLLIIFKNLNIKDLCKLSQTCRRFNNIIESLGQFLVENANLVTNQKHISVINRSLRILSALERLRISRNWKRGVYSEKSLLYSKIKYIPCIHLDRNVLWVSRGEYIRAYKRNQKSIDYNKVLHAFKGKTSSEICKFVNKNNHIFSGQSDGSLWLWSIEEQKFVFDKPDCHQTDVNGVDMVEDVLVSGSRDDTVKIWKNCDGDLVHSDTHDMGDRVWSVALNDDNSSLLAIGTARICKLSTLTIYDINCQKNTMKLGTHKFGDGILDITWQSPSVLWTCGYDACIRRWDLRTGRCEQTFDDPFGSVMYCFQYDYYNTIIGGTQNNGRVVLFDTRHKKCVQTYLMQCCRRISSPVYGVSFDAELLFAATDRHVSVLDFSTYNGNTRDYSKLISQDPFL